MDRIKYLIAGLLVTGLAMAHSVQAIIPAAVHLVGSTGLVRAGDTATVEVRVDSGGRIINAVDLNLVYDRAHLDLLRVDQQQSIWTLWPEQPQWDNQAGTVRLEAGRPHGLVAVDAPVATLIFRVLASGLAEVNVDAAQSGVHLNDGQGTRLSLTSQALELMLADGLVPVIPLDPLTSPPPDAWTSTNHVHIVWPTMAETGYSYRWSQNIEDQPDETAESAKGSVDFDGLDDGVYFFSLISRTGNGVWSRVSQYRFLLDTHPPEPFQLTIVPASQTGGRQTLSWTTTDATSGVSESRLVLNSRDRGSVKSPLLVPAAWRGKTVTIEVRDGAGNRQSASWSAPGGSIMIIEAAIIGTILVLITTTVVVRRRR